MHTNIFAYTENKLEMPGFMSLNQADDGKITLSLRSSAGPSGNAPVSELELSEEQLEHLERVLNERRVGVARSRAYEAVDSERAYQEAGKGNSAHPDGRHGAPNTLTPGEYILCMEKCLQDARDVWYKPEGGLKCLDFIRKVTGLGVAAMEHHGAPKREV